MIHHDTEFSVITRLSISNKAMHQVCCCAAHSLLYLSEQHITTRAGQNTRAYLVILYSVASEVKKQSLSQTGKQCQDPWKFLNLW